MPIFKRQSKRPGFKPLVYFKGTAEELGNARYWEMLHVFEKAGEELSSVAVLKENLIKAVNRLKEGESEIVGARLDKGSIALQVSKSTKGRILIKQHPLTHGITSKWPPKGKMSSFEALRSILKEGFKGSKGGRWNALLFDNRKRMSGLATEMTMDGKRKLALTKGDKYSIELMATADGAVNRGKFKGLNKVKSAPKETILRVNIELGTRDEKIIKAKKDFYKKKLKGIPISFL